MEDAQTPIADADRWQRLRYPPPWEPDPVIEAYKKHVDRSLLRENLKLTVTQRFEKHAAALKLVLELREAGKKLRRVQQRDGGGK